jgi:aromatic ring-opening dioxygenase catalytic subunit (LigB family)
MYQVEFKSKGDSALSARVVEAFKKVCLPAFPLEVVINAFSPVLQAGLNARTSPISEARGRDGRGHKGPGFDHGVFVPFKLMWGDEFTFIPLCLY